MITLDLADVTVDTLLAVNILVWLDYFVSCGQLWRLIVYATVKPATNTAHNVWDVVLLGAEQGNRTENQDDYGERQGENDQHGPRPFRGLEQSVQLAPVHGLTMLPIKMDCMSTPHDIRIQGLLGGR
jgi:hypothetical protein